MMNKPTEYFTMPVRRPKMYCSLGILPIAFCVLSSIAIIATYLLAVSNNHVYPFFPTISETGELEPERNVFSLLLSLASFISFIIVCIRYKQYNFVSEYNDLEQRKIVKVNQVCLVIGIVVSIGGAIVASFQADGGTSLKGHLAGATCTFAGGILYMWLNTYLSVKMIGCGINSKALCAFRFLASLVGMVAFIICVTARYISSNEWNNGMHKYSRRELWQPGDSGYEMHLVSSITEWITAITFLVYFLSFYKEFDEISFEFRIRRTNATALPFEVSGDEGNTPLLS